MKLKDFITPNKEVSKPTFIYISLAWLALFTCAGMVMKGELLPSVPDILNELYKLLTSVDFLIDLKTSTTLAIEAVLVTAVFGMILTYLSVLPVFSPLAIFTTKLRYLSTVGLQFVFLLIFGPGHFLKLAIIVFVMGTFFLTPMLELMKATPEEMIHAKTLGMSEWKIVFEVKFLGRLSEALELLRQTFAMAWSMLTMVEALIRSEGGIGVILSNQNRTFNLAQIFAIQIVIVLIGMLIDWMFRILNKQLFPYGDHK